MNNASQDGFGALKDQLGNLIASCTSVDERRIGYGNLRCEYSEWKRAHESVSNVAIIYETPGGSTCQINIDYDHNTGEFSYLNSELAETVTTDAAQDVLVMVATHVRSIPDRRVRRLQSQIDGWIGEGKTRSQLFGELNKLLQTEFLGGRINVTELKQGIQYAVTCYSSE